jgi:hypothetical protein
MNTMALLKTGLTVLAGLFAPMLLSWFVLGELRDDFPTIVALLVHWCAGVIFLFGGSMLGWNGWKGVRDLYLYFCKKGGAG